ncbi:hypothetical protein GCM10017788_61300 [Amycolatopsis acidiphila]|nr:hypothetical protein GCM10017788_61300 [Amycolatopsis acidiphila]
MFGSFPLQLAPKCGRCLAIKIESASGSVSSRNHLDTDGAGWLRLRKARNETRVAQQSRALRTIHDEPDPAVRYINALIPSLSENQARRHYERYVAPCFTADGRHEPSVAARAVSSVAEELGVSTVPDAADIYRREPAGYPRRSRADRTLRL